jgi:hypothetical protein
MTSARGKLTAAACHPTKAEELTYLSVNIVEQLILKAAFDYREHH